MLRHTYATIIDKMGISPKSCQYLLGHSDVSMTKNVYTHIQDEHLDIISEQLENIQSVSMQSSKRKTIGRKIVEFPE